MNASTIRAVSATLEDSVQASFSIPEAIAACAKARPDAPAVEAGGVTLTYAELEARAGRLAGHLRSLGVGPEVLVAVCFPRSVALVVAELAILKAGGAYLPLEPDSPRDRLSFLLHDARVSIVVSLEPASTVLPAGPWRIIGLDRDGRGEFSSCAGASLPEPLPEQLAYVIYTSGSTGRPKGVEITHANLENLVAWHRRAFQITAADRATLLASPAFDASVWETWPYLAAGASLHVPDDCVRLGSEALRDWLLQQGISISFLPTALAEPMLELRWPGGTPLRCLLTGADALRRRPTQQLPFSFINNYGPTECTVVATFGEVAEGSREGSLPTIGRAIHNAQVHILDEELRPVPFGEAGQLYIGGAGVGRGYRNHPELTAERFVPNPFTAPPARLYKTGDLARLTLSGEIDFLGRADEQIKLRGHRIEPNEIVNALDQLPLVAASVVVARTDARGEKRLVAYVVPAANGTLSAHVLRRALQTRLQDYMIPSVFVGIEQLPLTRNGKIDRAALPEPGVENILHDETFAAPAGPVQEKLAEIVAELLKVQQVSAHDNFFLIGGHSLLGAQLMARVNQHFAADLALREVFEAPTIAELAARIEDKLFKKVAALSEEDVRRLLQEANAN